MVQQQRRNCQRLAFRAGQPPMAEEEQGLPALAAGPLLGRVWPLRQQTRHVRGVAGDDRRVQAVLLQLGVARDQASRPPPSLRTVRVARVRTRAGRDAIVQTEGLRTVVNGLSNKEIAASREDEPPQVFERLRGKLVGTLLEERFQPPRRELDEPDVGDLAGSECFSIVHAVSACQGDAVEYVCSHHRRSSMSVPPPSDGGRGSSPCRCRSMSMANAAGPRSSFGPWMHGRATGRWCPSTG